jgi:hypothetical protein
VAKPKKTRRTQPTLTVDEICDRTGLDFGIVVRRLREAGVDPDGKHSLSVIAELQPTPPDKGAHIGEKKIYQEWRKLRIANDIASGVLVAEVGIVSLVHKLVRPVREVLDNRLSNEVVQRVVQSDDIPEARRNLRMWTDQTLRDIQKLGSLWR